PALQVGVEGAVSAAVVDDDIAAIAGASEVADETHRAGCAGDHRVTDIVGAVEVDSVGRVVVGTGLAGPDLTAAERHLEGGGRQRGGGGEDHYRARRHGGQRDAEKLHGHVLANRVTDVLQIAYVRAGSGLSPLQIGPAPDRPAPDRSSSAAAWRACPRAFTR